MKYSDFYGKDERPFLIPYMDDRARLTGYFREHMESPILPPNPTVFISRRSKLWESVCQGCGCINGHLPEMHKRTGIPIG
jgi:hypothetical protein